MFSKYSFLVKLILILLFAPHNLFGQQISVHTDRAIYFPGDTIWFKAYFLYNNAFDEEIKNLYFSPFSQNNGVSTPLQESVWYVDRGTSVGQYVIPRTFSNHHLYLSFFTKRSLKIPQYQYVKKLLIVQEDSTNTIVNNFVYDQKKIEPTQIDTSNLIKPILNIEKLSHLPLGENCINLSLSTSEAANLSISITDISVPVDTVRNIITDFQSISFMNNNLDINDHILYLYGKMGYKKSGWNKFYERYQKYQLKDKKAGKPERGFSLSYRISNDSITQYSEVYFDKNGDFEAKDVFFSDTLEVKAVQIYDKLKYTDFTTQYFFNDLSGWHRHNYDIKMITKDSTMDNTVLSKLSIPYHPDYIIDRNGMRFLKTVDVNRKIDLKLKQMANKLSRGWFAENQSYLDIDVQNDFSIPGYIHTLSDYIEYLYNKYPKIRTFRPVILFNNIEVNPFDKSVNTSYVPESLDEIKMVRIYKSYPRNMKQGGAIMIYASMFGRNMYGRQTVGLSKVAGYMSPLKFNIPQYTLSTKDTHPSHDDRLTLYWEPNINIDTTNSSSDLKFYNNSNAKGFHIVINGMTDSGKLIFYEKSFMK